MSWAVTNDVDHLSLLLGQGRRLPIQSLVALLGPGFLRFCSFEPSSIQLLLLFNLSWKVLEGVVLGAPVEDAAQLLLGDLDDGVQFLAAVHQLQILEQLHVGEVVVRAKLVPLPRRTRPPLGSTRSHLDFS